MIKQFHEKPKSKKLINLQSKILDYLYANKVPEEKSIIKILDEIFKTGWNAALKFTWDIEESNGEYVRTGVNEFYKL